MVSEGDSHAPRFQLKRSQGWRGSVKVRRLIIALKDYYLEKAARCSGTPTVSDCLAVKYINTSHARNILEAFDGDGSGFMTVNEVNRFTQSRPLGWRYAPFSLVCKAYLLIHTEAFPTG